MSTVRKPIYTVAEYLALEAASPDKHEFYQGEIFAMAGATTAHNRISGNIYWRLAQQLEGRPCLPNHSDVMVNADSLYTYPDVSVACPPIEREPASIEILLNPKVLVEVLSPTTERYDRNVKFRHYIRMPSVAEILLVQQDAPVVEHYRRQPDGLFALTSIEGLEHEVLLACIDCRLAMEEIYARVEFPEDPFPIVAP